jgi:hypothetical protein
MTESARTGLRRALLELAENVVLHAGPTQGIAGAQGWPALRQVELTIVDRGIGIPNGLRRNPEWQHLSDREALLKGLEIGVTGAVAPTPGYGARRGYGLWEVSELVAVNGGRLHVRCGNYSLIQEGGVPPRVEGVADGWPGTIVVVSFDLDGSFDLEPSWASALPPGTPLDDEITL